MNLSEHTGSGDDCFHLTGKGNCTNTELKQDREPGQPWKHSRNTHPTPQDLAPLK